MMTGHPGDERDNPRVFRALKALRDVQSGGAGWAKSTPSAAKNGAGKSDGLMKVPQRRLSHGFL